MLADRGGGPVPVVESSLHATRNEQAVRRVMSGGRRETVAGIRVNSTSLLPPRRVAPTVEAPYFKLDRRGRRQIRG